MYPPPRGDQEHELPTAMIEQRKSWLRLRRVVNSAIFVAGGLLWFGFALGFGFFLMQYVNQGAGLQFFGLGVSSMTVLLGLAQVMGLVTASALCFAIGVGLCAHGLVPLPELNEQKTAR